MFQRERKMTTRTLALLVVLAAVSSANKQCYSCNSQADCERTGVGRVQTCDSRQQCYTVLFNGRVMMKGCTDGCNFVERGSHLHVCHTCVGELCNHHPAAGIQDNGGIGGGAQPYPQGGGGIGSGANPGQQPYGQNIGGGTGIGSGAGFGNGGNGYGIGGGIGQGAAPGVDVGGGIGAHSGHKHQHHKRNVGGGYDPYGVGNGAQPGWNSNPSGNIGGGAVPNGYGGGNSGYGGGYDYPPYNSHHRGYPGIGGGAYPTRAATTSASLLTMVAPIFAYVLRR